ncbi:uncharacterized protein VNE69_07221 [Vairimorpha necatrix]|uniref:Dynein heavy chain hydrolytic ATP-binding dynein motor region domain-containing protein n=1 Tax=Vairimorpha necatrix TaxID=6039 RepID=A0AAX4JDU2_9MICR
MIHRLNYQDFIKTVSKISESESAISIPKSTDDIPFLEMLLNFSDASYIKLRILQESGFSIKVSKEYLNNKKKYFKQEGEYIRRQIEDFYNSSSIRLIDLSYLVIFFKSDFYKDLIDKLDYVSTKRHQMLYDFEELFYRTLDIENCLISKNPIDILGILDACKVYNLDIHKHILKILKYATNEPKKIPQYKRLLDLINKKSLLFTTNDENIEFYKEKFLKFEQINSLRNIVHKYKANDLFLEIKNVEENIKLILPILKREFVSCKNINQQITLMKDFSIFMSYKEFLDNTSAERMKIYEHLICILQTKTSEISHIIEIVRYTKQLLHLFFRQENNLFVETLNRKICYYEEIINKQNQKKDIKYLLNSILVTTKDYDLEINCDPFFNDLLNYFKKDYKIDSIKRLKKSIECFIEITKTIDDVEYEMFLDEIEEIFNILQKIINLKIKFYISRGYDLDLKKEVNNLNYKLIEHRLMILKFEEMNKSSMKFLLMSNPHLCKINRIADTYLNNIFKDQNLKVNISSEKDLYKILDLIHEIFFDKNLFTKNLSSIIDNILDTHTRLTEYIDLIYKSRNMNVYEIFKTFKKLHKIRKDLPQYVNLSCTTKLSTLKTKLTRHFYQNQDIIKRPFDNIKDTILIYKIGTKILKKDIVIDLPHVESFSEIIKFAEEWICTFSKFISNQEKNFNYSEFKIFYSDFKHKMSQYKKSKKLYEILKSKNDLNVKIKDLKINEDKKTNEIRTLCNHLKFTKYIFSDIKSEKILDWLFLHAPENFENIYALQFIKELSNHKDKSFINILDKHKYICDVIKNISEFEMREYSRKINLIMEIYQKLTKIENDIKKIKYSCDELLNFENRNLFFKIIERVGDELQDLDVDLDFLNHNLINNGLDSTDQNLLTIISDLKSEVEDLISKNNEICSLFVDICKYTNLSLFDDFLYELQNPLIELKLDRILREKEIYKEKFTKKIEDLKNRISDLYFVSNDDLINFVNGKLPIEDLLKNIYNIDKLIIENNECLGVESKKEKIYFSTKLDLSSIFKAPEDFELFYRRFKLEFKNVLISYFNKKDKNKIQFLDDFINEYKFFNDLDFEETTKIKFIKKHQEILGPDFTLLYPKPQISKSEDSLECFTDSLNLLPFEMIYYPPSNILYTRLTNTIFNKITLGLFYYPGLILYGESSTGKTETVKYYCKSIGRPLYVFCCNENLNIILLENIIQGCIKNNWYLCLDECNRLGFNVMSKLSDLLVEHKDKIKIFLTLNIGYLGRNKLPTTLKSLFAEIRVDNPNIEDILDVYFNEEMKTLFRNLKEKSQNLSHYNFSLRALNTILFNLKDSDVTQNMLIYYYALFSDKDKSLLSEYLPSLTKEEVFEYGISSSTGILLFGESLSGKSEILRKMINLRNINHYIFHYYDEDILYRILKENTNGDLWIIYDCILESKWIENLNSVLDDNKILCMRNGEVIKIRENVRFIFETNDISKLTPASLTRVFTIYFERDISQSNKNIVNINDIKNNTVTFLEGEMGIGKKSKFKEIVKNEEVLYLNCREIKSLKNYKKDIIYLEEYEKASDDVIQEIKELHEHGTVKDEERNMKIICSYNGSEDLNIYNFKRRINCPILQIRPNEKILEMSQGDHDMTIQNNLEIIQNHDKITHRDIYEYYKQGDIKFYECFKILRNLHINKEYFRDILNVNSPICNREIIEFCLENKFNFILLGGRLTGKNWILRNYNIRKIEIFNETCKIEYDTEKVTGILTTSLDLLSNEIIKENMIIRLFTPRHYLLDLKYFIEDLDNNEETSFMKYIRNLKYKTCGCCINEEIIMNNYITVEDIMRNDISKLNNDENYNKKDDVKLSSKNIDDVDLLSFKNIYKLVDFIQTTVSTYKEFIKSNKFILDGLEKIKIFHNISQDKKINLHKHDLILVKYQEEINQKILKIQSLEKDCEYEKNIIKNKKQEHLAFYNEIEKKKNFIKNNLQEGEVKLQESIKKINKITKKNIAEIRSMNSPPKAVHYIINIIYNMVNKRKEKKTWQECLVFLKTFDINSISKSNNQRSKDDNINDVNNDYKLINDNEEDIFDLDIEELKDKEVEISKSSHVCYLLYEWILHNYEYKRLKEDIKPLEEEIKDLLKKGNLALVNIKEEEEKYEILEKRLSEYKREYSECQVLLVKTQREISNLKDEILKYDDLISKINEEKSNWTESEFGLELVLPKLFINKILLSSSHTGDYLETSMKDKNYKKIISNIYKYKRNIKINNVTQDEEIYRLCKYLIREKDFSIIINQDTDFYECIGYTHEVVEEYPHEEDINIKELQDELLRNIVLGDINKILGTKRVLDLERKRLEGIRRIREYYDMLNRVYKILYTRYKLSFKVYDEFIRNEDLYISKNDTYESNFIRKDVTDTFNINILDNVNIKHNEGNVLLDKCIKYCTHLDLEDIKKYKSNILIITNTDDYVYYLEKNIKFKNIISLGDKKSNEIYSDLLKRGSDLYLIKNIDLYDKLVEDESENKFVYISEYSRSRKMIKDCRVIYMKYKYNYKRSLELYRRLYGTENQEIIKYHCKLIGNLYRHNLEKKYTFSVRDLEIIINYKETISMEYLRYLVYKNKLDEEDEEKVMNITPI